MGKRHLGQTRLSWKNSEGKIFELTLKWQYLQIHILVNIYKLSAIWNRRFLLSSQMSKAKKERSSE